MKFDSTNLNPQIAVKFSNEIAEFAEKLIFSDEKMTGDLTAADLQAYLMIIHLTALDIHMRKFSNDHPEALLATKKIMENIYGAVYSSFSGSDR
jgi:hypothetical protein